MNWVLLQVKSFILGCCFRYFCFHVADVVGPEGLVYAVEFSHRPGRELIGMAKRDQMLFQS